MGQRCGMNMLREDTRREQEGRNYRLGRRVLVSPGLSVRGVKYDDVRLSIRVFDSFLYLSDIMFMELSACLPINLFTIYFMLLSNHTFNLIMDTIDSVLYPFVGSSITFIFTASLKTDEVLIV